MRDGIGNVGGASNGMADPRGSSRRPTADRAAWEAERQASHERHLADLAAKARAFDAIASGAVTVRLVVAPDRIASADCVHGDQWFSVVRESDWETHNDTDKLRAQLRELRSLADREAEARRDKREGFARGWRAMANGAPCANDAEASALLAYPEPAPRHPSVTVPNLRDEWPTLYELAERGGLSFTQAELRALLALTETTNAR